MNKLPEYFCIKRDADNPLWDKYIKWLNKKFDVRLSGGFFDYYGWNPTSRTDRVLSLGSDYISSNTSEITLEQWDAIVNPKPEFKVGDWITYTNTVPQSAHQIMSITESTYYFEDGKQATRVITQVRLSTPEEIDAAFVLPKKWCIKRTLFNCKEVNRWFNANRQTQGIFTEGGVKNRIDKNHLHYPAIIGFNGPQFAHHSNTYLAEGYTEITFEQFKKHVMGNNKKGQMPEKWFIPACTKLANYFSALPHTSFYSGNRLAGNVKNRVYFLKNNRWATTISDTLLEQGYVGITFEMFNSQPQKAGNQLLGYKWASPTIKDTFITAAELLLKGLNAYGYLSATELPIKATDELTIQAFADAKVLDIWFTPVYGKDTKAKTIAIKTVFDTYFDVTVSTDGIFYAEEGFYLDPKGLQKLLSSSVTVYTSKLAKEWKIAEDHFSTTPYAINIGCKKGVLAESIKEVLDYYKQITK